MKIKSTALRSTMLCLMLSVFSIAATAHPVDSDRAAAESFSSWVGVTLDQLADALNNWVEDLLVATFEEDAQVPDTGQVPNPGDDASSEVDPPMEYLGGVILPNG